MTSKATYKAGRPFEHVVDPAFPLSRDIRSYYLPAQLETPGKGQLRTKLKTACYTEGELAMR